ncbi:MAG: type II toxin-antitoxin system RelE/ParE family toxin [Armatimonadetes bacterium]|nr:type II toxin-antitoxin system RelE/ParE family toxin [Armatimonadota bacterium]
MARLIWSPEAVKDLEGICEYIARDSMHYARVFAMRVISLAEQIADQPMAGRVVPEYQSEHLRERILQNYRIVYRVKTDTVEIAAVVHGARLMFGSPADSGG